MAIMDTNDNPTGRNVDFGDESTNCENTLLNPQAAGANNKLPVERINNDAQIDIDIPDSNAATGLITPDEIPFVTMWCLILLIRPIVMRVYDFVNDVGLAFEYFGNDRTAYGIFTLACTTLQAITTAWISSMIHHPKLVVTDNKKEDKREQNFWDKAAKLIARYGIIIPFLLAMPLCNLRNLYYAWKVRKYQLKGDEAGLRPYHRMMLVEERDLALLEVVACCLQAAPQLILQLCILLTEYQPINYAMWFKIISGCITLVNLGSAMTDYYCAIRKAQPDRAEVSDVGRAFLFLWNFGVIAARVFTIAISASKWPLCTFIACMVNLIVWTVWIYAKENGASLILLGRKATDTSVSESKTMGKKIRNLFFAVDLALVYTFTLVNLRQGRSVIRNSVYYVICASQNVTIFVLYFILTNVTMEEVLLSKYLLIVSVIFFVVGITTMITYYKYFHPSTAQSLADFEIDDERCLGFADCWHV